MYIHPLHACLLVRGTEGRERRSSWLLPGCCCGDTVIEEARATIEDALEAAEVAKEQARAAEIALRDRMGVLDELARSEGKVIKYQETIDGLESKLYRGQLETKQLQLEAKVRSTL